MSTSKSGRVKGDRTLEAYDPSLSLIWDRLTKSFTWDKQINRMPMRKVPAQGPDGDEEDLYFPEPWN